VARREYRSVGVGHVDMASVGHRGSDFDDGASREAGEGLDRRT
jgi:hypothetical protein